MYYRTICHSLDICAHARLHAISFSTLAAISARSWLHLRALRTFCAVFVFAYRVHQYLCCKQHFGLINTKADYTHTQTNT